MLDLVQQFGRLLDDAEAGVTEGYDPVEWKQGKLQDIRNSIQFPIGDTLKETKRRMMRCGRRPKSELVAGEAL